jgi:GGDEF domain-containing protein
MYPADGGDPETLLQRADAAMYLSKQQGGNRIVFASGAALRDVCTVP